jgi:hypothetical protein
MAAEKPDLVLRQRNGPSCKRIECGTFAISESYQSQAGETRSLHRKDASARQRSRRPQGC